MDLKEKLRRARNLGLWQRPGHYYSPIPSQRDRERPPWEPYGIDLKHAEQARMAATVARASRDLPASRLPSWRWFGPNQMFSQPDAGVCYAMLAHLKPAKVIEVGSGFSTAVMLDAIERHLLPTTVTCVEPYPQRLRSLLKPRDQVTVVETGAQDCPLETLTDLGPGDVLFVDSTHVVKTGSDVVFLFLHVIPRLKPGVFVHVHDIHWPFTYPKRWLDEGRAWNETYLLQALLLGKVLDVVLWPSYLAACGMPQFKSGGSIWCVKT